MHPEDSVLIAVEQLIGGTTCNGVIIKGLIPAGHKFARHNISKGSPILRYGQIIGFALREIQTGEHVHSHNLGMGSHNRDYKISSEIKPLPISRENTFLGFKRPNGKVATRNYIGILTTVNCSATVAKSIADFFNKNNSSSPLHSYPGVDGVVALTHSSGCGMDQSGNGIEILRRVLSGYAQHPNFAAVLVIGLGCEVSQINQISWGNDLESTPIVQAFNIQDVGGTSAAVSKGIEYIIGLLEVANSEKRLACGVEGIVLGLQCGGSDGYSGISANPALGYAVDLLVAHGGTAILSETPEIYGAEHLLIRRVINHKVGESLIDRINWWEKYVFANSGTMDNNPSPGNKAGGLTTILEKSLGAISKGGTTSLNEVFEYAESVSGVRGLVFMDTPGYDPVSATGQVAGGANVICFTTGRGSAYGCAPVPSLKLSTNTALWNRQRDDIDINCGEIIDGDATVEEIGEKIFQSIIAVASGVKTKSEIHGYGQNEFVPWQIGAVM